MDVFSCAALAIEVGKRLRAENVGGVGNRLVARRRAPKRVFLDIGSGFKRVVIGVGSGAAEVTRPVEGYPYTQGGLLGLGSGETTSGPGRSPGVVVPVIVTAATASPTGLIVTWPLKVGSELSGRKTIEGAGEKMADRIADELEMKFREQGWLEH